MVRSVARSTDILIGQALTCKSQWEGVRGIFPLLAASPSAGPQGHNGDRDTAQPAIQIRELRKVYGTKAAVDGLNLKSPGLFSVSSAPTARANNHHQDAHGAYYTHIG
jgi:hypothetical protein